MKIYVGNLNYTAEETNLSEVFEEFSIVDSIKIIRDKGTSKSKGFGYIDMPNCQEATTAMEELNHT